MLFEKKKKENEKKQKKKEGRGEQKDERKEGRKGGEKGGRKEIERKKVCFQQLRQASNIFDSVTVSNSWSHKTS